eukprot:gene17327-biopygen9853
MPKLRIPFCKGDDDCTSFPPAGRCELPEAGPRQPLKEELERCYAHPHHPRAWAARRAGGGCAARGGAFPAQNRSRGCPGNLQKGLPRACCSGQRFASSCSVRSFPTMYLAFVPHPPGAQMIQMGSGVAKK